MIIQEFQLTAVELIQKFPNWLSHAHGSLDTKVHRINTAALAASGDLIFCNSERAVQSGLNSLASVLVVPAKLASALSPGTKCVLSAKNVELAMATCIQELALKSPYREPGRTGPHASCVIDSTAFVDPSAIIGPGAYIGPRVRIGTGAYIGANSVIEADSVIGENTTLHPLVFIGHSTEIGARCDISSHTTVAKEGFGYAHDENGNHYRIPHQGKVVIEDDVHLGASNTIDRGTFGETRIGRGCKFDNHVHLGHNTKIGANGLVTARFTMGGSSEIGKNFLAGGGSVVTGHIKVGDGVHIAALSGIAKDLDVPGQYGGVPLVPLQQHIKIKAAMAQLPEMRKQLSRLLKKVFPNEET